MEPSDALSKKTIDLEMDVYRDTPVRYLGYANEVGEAFRAIIGSKLVLASYGVATLYVLADTVDKSTRIYNDISIEKRQLKTAYTASDTLIWQMLASVAIPGFTINRICAASNYLLKKGAGDLGKNPRRALVTGIGLLTIPFIIKPIDRLVDIFMDETFRKFKPV